MKFLFIVLILRHSIDATFNSNLLKDYLQWQHLRIATIFHCLDQNNDILSLSLEISRSYPGKIHFENISNFTESRWNHSHVMRYDYHKLGACIDLSCPGTTKLFQVISNHEYFNSSYYWLLFGTESPDTAFCLLNEQNLNIDAKVTLVVDRGQDLDVIYDVYDVFSPSISYGAALNVTTMGTWRTVGGFDFVVNQTEYERRVDFGGISLKAAVTPLNQVHHSTLLEHLISNDSITTYALHRFGYRMMELVMAKHNFSFKLVRTSSWGLSNTDGRSNIGIIGQVATKQVDLAINVLAYTQPRIGIFDYTVTVSLSRMLIVFRHPRILQGRNFFLQPFHMDLWIAVLVINLLAVGIVFGSFCGEGIKLYGNREVVDNRGLSWLTVFGILFQQSSHCRTYLSSTRIALISLLLFSVLIWQFYSAYIVGYLLIVPPKTMSTLQHLLDSDLKVIVEDLSYNADYLNKTKDPVAIELYHRKILNGENNFMNVSEGISWVQRGGYAFQCDTAYAYPMVKQTFTDKEICDLQETFLNPIRPMHIPLRKGSPFKEMFRITLRKTVETGIARYQQKTYFTDKPKCDRNDLEVVAVDLDHVLMLFYGLGVWLVGCFCLMLLERGWFLFLKQAFVHG